jgi:hypothetical protein
MPNNRLFCLLVALRLGTVGFAQETASIRGVVRNALDGAPIARAHVSVQNGQRRYASLTDAAGNFTITGLALGSSHISADRVGFARNIQPQELELSGGQNKTGIELKLTPTGGITGTIFDPEGQPVQMAEVWALGPENEIRVTTDNRGHYRLGGLSAGKYQVKALVSSRRMPPETRSDGTQDVHYPAVYYPGVLLSKEATRVTVGPGQDTQAIDLRLVASPIIRVSGKILNAPPGRVAIELMYATSPGSEVGEEREAEPDGSFVLWGLDPGKYTLKASVGGGEDAPQSARVPIDVGTANIDGIELRVVEPLEIAGRIVFEDEQARAKASPPQNAPPEERTMHVMLQPLNEGNTLQVPVGADSTFHLEKVPPGRYRMATNAFGSIFVRSMNWGGVQVDGNILDTQNGSVSSDLVLTISGKTTQIHGTVTNAKGPVPNATVHLLVDGTAVSDLELFTNEAGKYFLGDLPPGIYGILAIDGSIEDLRFLDSSFSDYEDSMVKVEVHSGDNITQDLKLAVATK